MPLLDGQGGDSFLEGALARLAPLERRVLELQFGLEDGRRRTFEEVATELQLTPSRVRGLETHALQSLRSIWQYEKPPE